MKKIVVFSGAGISADSGISTFRDSDGLWAKYRIEDLCTPEALAGNRDQVIDFYNMRRKELLSKRPNDAHRCILKLLERYDVEVVTQNIDDLHERAAAEAGVELKVTHLHGELRKLRSSADENATVPIRGWEQDPRARHPDGSLLRPFVVFFGESVTMYEEGCRIAAGADIMIVVGTSLQVYPAAMIVNRVRNDIPIYLIDPGSPVCGVPNKVIHIKERAPAGMAFVVKELLDAQACGQEGK